MIILKSTIISVLITIILITVINLLQTTTVVYIPKYIPYEVNTCNMT